MKWYSISNPPKLDGIYKVKYNKGLIGEIPYVTSRGNKIWLAEFLGVTNWNITHWAHLPKSKPDTSINDNLTINEKP